MLSDNGIRDVKVLSTPGMLKDHYDPRTKTVNLSEGVNMQQNASAAEVAAHECGHAVQHATGYEWLQLRSTLVPMVRDASNFSMYIIFGGLIASQTPAFGQTIALIGVRLCRLGILFSFITLPVEYDASNRALDWLKRKNMVSQQELEGATDALKWAARTYVVAALASLATLMYLLFRVMGNSRD